MALRNKRGTRGGDDKAVLKRAQRLHRAYLREHLIPKLGLSAEATDEQINAAILDLKKKVEDVEAGNSPDLVKQVEALKAENAVLKKKALKAIRIAKAAESEREDLKVESEIRENALASGVRDIDYAMHLFRNHVRGLPEGSAEPDPKSFFAELKKDEAKKYLFEAAAAPTTVMAGTRTVAEETQNRTETTPPARTTTPTPPAGTETPPPVDATKMSKAEFREHQRKNYGIGSVTASIG